jgi:hypothetical protein
MILKISLITFSINRPIDYIIIVKNKIDENVSN